MDINLAKIFENIGFDQKESKTYLALLELGQGTATKISKQAQLKRAIIYHVLERLKKKGVRSRAQRRKSEKIFRLRSFPSFTKCQRRRRESPGGYADRQGHAGKRPK